MSGGTIDWREVFFSALQRDPKGALREYHLLITDAAMRGDADFFKRISLEIRKGQRRSGAPGDLEFAVLTFWLVGFLWLMSDDTGYSYLKSRCEFKFGFEAYLSTRRRLGLVGYETFSRRPIIVGHDITTGRFQFLKGWSSLAQA